jgi:hypothetical protein
MTFPRGVALAEVGWSKKEDRNYANFLDRLSSYLTRMDYRSVNYAKHFFEIKTQTSRDANNVLICRCCVITMERLSITPPTVARQHSNQTCTRSYFDFANYQYQSGHRHER